MMNEIKKRNERIALLILLGGALVFALMLWYAIGYGVSAGWTSSYHRADRTDVGLTLRLASAGRGFFDVEPYDSASNLLIPSRKTRIYVRFKKNKGQTKIYRSNEKHTQTGTLFAIASSAGYAKLEVQFMQPQELGLPARLVFNRVMPS